VARPGDTGTTARQLAEREAELRAQLADIEAASRRSTAGGIGFGKRVGDGTNIAVERMTEVAAHSGLQRELAQIAKARAALAAGTYGTCEACGAEIGAGRMEARPASTRCVRCA
jgi:RNA polymerase-binding transcription factor DksA